METKYAFKWLIVPWLIDRVNLFAKFRYHVRSVRTVVMVSTTRASKGVVYRGNFVSHGCFCGLEATWFNGIFYIDGAGQANSITTCCLLSNPRNANVWVINHYLWHILLKLMAAVEGTCQKMPSRGKKFGEYRKSPFHPAFYNSINPSAI